MATFPAIAPTYGAQKNSAPTVRVVQFGDGYQHRLSFGLNQNPRAWSLTFNVSEADANTIDDFLIARSVDGASFDWTPPDEASPLKWISYQWTKTIPYNNRATIEVTFLQVFEP